MGPEEIIGFAAFGLNVAGNWMLTAKRQRGWIVRILANVAQVAYAACLPSPSLAMNGATFLAINVVGWRRWQAIGDGHTDKCRSVWFRPCNCGRFS